MTWLTNPYRFGGSVPIGTRSYWRIGFLSKRLSAYSEIVEIEMAAAPGGADQCTGGTPLGFGTAPIGTLADGFDNNTATWVGKTSFEHIDTVKYGYSFATPVSVAEIRLQARTGGNETRCPVAFVVEYSDDGTTWQFCCYCYSASEYSSGGVQSFPVSLTTLPALTRANARLWRLQATANNGGGNTTMHEVILRASSGGANLAEGRPVCQNSGNGPYAVDGISGNQYGLSTGMLTPGTGVTIFFPTAPNPTHVALKAPGIFAGTDMVKTFKFQYSDAGVNWVDALSRANETGWANNEVREWAL